MEQRLAECSPLLQSVLYHYNKTPRPERPRYLANLVEVRDRCLSDGALATLPASEQVYVLRQAGWLALLADEPVGNAEAFFDAGSDLLPADLRQNHLLVYVKNALLYLTHLVNHQFQKAQAVRLSPVWQHRSPIHWRTVNHLVRHAEGMRRSCTELLRAPGERLDKLALAEVRELIDQGLIGIPLLPSKDPALVRLRQQLAVLPERTTSISARDTKLGLSVVVLSAAAVVCTTWLLWNL
jgi:hypothetical protein